MAGSIAILSHREGNIGHHFMALGITEAVKDAFGSEVPIVHFEQHRPLGVLPAGHWAHTVFQWNHRFFRLPRRLLASDKMRDRLWRDVQPMSYRLAVACGGPNLVPGAHKAPEMRMLLHHMNGAFAQCGVPVVDAAVGAAFPLERPPHRFKDSRDTEFYRRALSYVSCITVRETVAKAVCSDLGRDAPLIPCAAIGVGRVLEPSVADSDQDGHVVINYQAHGANTDWGQQVDKEHWRRTVRGVIDKIAPHHRVRLLAHSAYEARLAAEIAPELPCDHPQDIDSYARAIGGAKAGFVSRIHAAVALAGIGVPSVVVGTDTRLRTAETLGLPTFPVKEASIESITAALDDLLSRRNRERDRLRELRESTLGKYSRIFQEHAK